MATYYARADLKDRLPVGHGLSDGELDGIITDASAWVEEALQPDYWPFPDVTGTPATPTSVQEATKHYALYMVHERMLASNRFREQSVPGWHHDQSMLIVAELRDGRRELAKQLVSSESLSFGTLDSDYPDWHGLAKTQVEVWPETATISGYQYGWDFDVMYSEPHRRWVLQRNTSDITDSDTVSYYISYRRRREIDATSPIRFDGIRIVRA